MSFERGLAYCHVVPSANGKSLALLQSDGHAVRVGLNYVPHQHATAWPVEIVLAVADDLLEERKKKAKAAKPEEKPPSEMNKAELEARAGELNIDLSEASNNNERRALIAEALEEDD